VKMEKIRSVYKTIEKKFFGESFTQDKDFDNILRFHWLMGILGKENDKKWKSLISCGIFNTSIFIGTIFIMKFSYNEHKMILNPIFPLILFLRNVMLNLDLIAFILKKHDLYSFIRKTIEIKKIMAVNSDFESTKRSLFKTYTKAHFVVMMLLFLVRVFRTLSLLNEKCVILVILEIQRPSNDILHYSLSIMNFIQTLYIPNIIIFQDILVSFGISKLEEIFYDLTLKVKMVTNHRNPIVNSRKLDEFIKLHVEALKALELYHKCFDTSLFLKTFFMMTLIAAAFLNAVSFNQFT
jgi:hypothetical protein